jgi:negative regulator of flagellin synthesis FlgM
MIDRISLNLGRTAASHAYGVPAPADGARAAAAPTAPRRDALELSPVANDVRTARTALAAVPEVRAERVAALRQAIATGSYQVDPELLARRLLGE